MPPIYGWHSSLSHTSGRFQAGCGDFEPVFEWMRDNLVKLNLEKTGVTSSQKGLLRI